MSPACETLMVRAHSNAFGDQACSTDVTDVRSVHAPPAAADWEREGGERGRRASVTHSSLSLDVCFAFEK